MSELSTELPTKFGPAEIEARWLQFWNENDFYRPVDDPARGTDEGVCATPESRSHADAAQTPSSVHARSSDAAQTPSSVHARSSDVAQTPSSVHDGVNSTRPAYVIAIPPPNVTGILHMGHALNNTLQDILIRWRRMSGDNTLWLPGTDHASIATEGKVTQKLRDQGIDKHAIGREEFLKHAWDWTREYGGTIIKQLKRMGCSCDWSRERFTMDATCSRAVRVAFKRLYDRGLIYRGKYLVNWCPACRTVISNDEVEYKEQKGHLWHIRYLLKEEIDAADEASPHAGIIPSALGQEYLTVATTRPETMLGDTAVAVNPNDQRNRRLIGKTCILPLLNREIPIIGDAFVDPAFGTGCVKVTPGHDPNDFEMGRRHDLPLINILNEDGTLNANAGAYAGLDRFKARERVVADLEQQGLLSKIEDYTNNVGHCYRSGDVVEPYLSDQWFVKMKPLAEPALAAVREGRTKIVPRQYENTYYHWMENVRDWPISRQLFWGHQIPIWYKKSDRSIILCHDGDGVPPEVAAAPHEWEQDPDVLDTWFSSALWPFSTLGWPDETPDLKTFYPTNTLVTAHEILFFWVARMIMMGLECTGRTPFADVYIHAMIFDLETRSKMSKSKGNIIDPLQMIAKYGADAMRFTLCAYAIQGRNIYLSEQRFEGYRNFMNKLWNAARFVLLNTADLSADEFAAPPAPQALKLEDRWILSELARVTQAVEQDLGSFAFDSVGFEIYHFIWDKYCDWYIEFAKARLTDLFPEDKKVAQKILLTVLENILRLLHPIAPFISEELWQTLREKFGGGKIDGPLALSAAQLLNKTIMLAAFPQASDHPRDETAEREMQSLQEIITTIRRLRSEVRIAPKNCTDVTLAAAADAGRRDFLEAHKEYFKICIPIGELRIAATAHADRFTLTGVAGGVTVALPLSAELRHGELERLQKEIPQLEQGIANLRQKLSNEKFVASKPELAEKERRRLADLETELQKAKEKLTALAG